jgi:hypothetical protein
MLCFWGLGTLHGDTGSEKEAVVAAAMDYMEGAHSGDVSRIERSVHPELTKVSVRKVPKSGEMFLYKAGFTRLREVVRANLVPLEKDKLDQIRVKVFAVREGLAAAVSISPFFYDYQLFAKIDGKWMLINVLWTRNPENSKEEPVTPEQLEKDKTAIKKASLDYIEGYFSGDAVRMARGVHPELTKVFPAVLKKTGKTMLNKTTASLLVAYSKAKAGLLAEDKRKINVRILDVQKNIAMVEVISAIYYDYLQLAKIDGQWRIVNVLWKVNPTAPKPERS